MRTLIVALVILCALVPAGFAATFSLTAEAALNFATLPTAEEAVQIFTQNTQPFWGIGWEVVLRRIGFGGTYMVKFFQDDLSNWKMDWYGQALYVSYHFLGSAFFDPFIQAGVGCAGQVALESDFVFDDYGFTTYPLPLISIFPVLTAGITFHLEAFTLGARFSYFPFVTPPPATLITAYPVGSFQIGVYAGVTLGR